VDPDLHDAPASGHWPEAGVVFGPRRLLGAILFALLVLVPAVPLTVAANATARPLLPDLGIAPIPTPLVTRTLTGVRFLRFTVSIANVGKGPIVVDGARPRQGVPFTTWQKVMRSDGTSYRLPTPGAIPVYNGSKEHGHWHIHGAARYELRPLGRKKPVRIRLKRGFCLFDSTQYELSLPGAPRVGRYPREGCGKKADLRFEMGVSVGWKDDYFWRIPGQEMNITNLPNGRYRLYVTVDPRNWFLESNDGNNASWVDIEIDGMSVRTLGRSPRV
jgi:hypothetical protein